MEKKIYSVAEITATIKQLLETSLPTLWVEGEISNFRPHYSGHFYFTLKDANAQLSAVMWRSRTERIAFELQDGMRVQALGNLRLYEKAGRYQLDILQMQPAGAGDLQQAFEELKNKLLDEGLFDSSYKKILPVMPTKIGVITSPTGAAIRDIMDVLKRRAPYATIVFRPASVQGIQASQDLTNAVDEIEAYGDVDVLIIGRGGGSLEDLWVFNDEVLARRIHACEIPVVSAVGHEIDFTISDLVADVRAATPSAAAEIVAADKAELSANIQAIQHSMQRSMQRRLIEYKDKVLQLYQSYGVRRVADRVLQNMQRLDELHVRLGRTEMSLITQQRERIMSLDKVLDGLNPKNVLKRGYSVTVYKGEVITSSRALKKGDLLESQFADGKISSRVEMDK